MTSVRRQCLNCKHYLGKNECKAFDNIPDVIVYNKHDHREPYPGDNGIRFEPIEKRPDDRPS